MGEVYAGPGARTCSHSGCNWPAAATLGFDYESQRAWLDDLSVEEDPASYDLCSIHADRFSPPRGWTSQDHRRLAEPIFRLPEVVRPEVEPEIKRDTTKSFNGAEPIAGSTPAILPNQSALPDL